MSNYIVGVWSPTPRYTESPVNYYECDTYEEALTFAKREAELLDTLGREYDINVYVNESLLEEVQYESTEDE